eukprot:Opistho-1_new@66167
MLRERDEQLHGGCGRHKGEARPRHGALLVERAIAHGIGWRHDVVAKVAPQCGGHVTPVGAWPASAVAHDDVRVEAERRVNDPFATGARKDRRQPATLARVHEKKDNVVRIDELLQARHVSLHSRRKRRVLWHRVAGHGNRHRHANRIHPREYALQTVRRRLRLRSPPAQAVFEFKQRLARGIGEGHGAAVHQRDLAHAPPHKAAGDVAPERAGAEEKAAHPRDALQIERRDQAPSHELEVEADGRVGQPRGVHGGTEVDHAGPQLVPRVLLPADNLRSLRDSALGKADSENDACRVVKYATAPRSAVAQHAHGFRPWCRCTGRCRKSHQQIAERPSGMGRERTGVRHADKHLPRGSGRPLKPRPQGANVHRALGSTDANGKVAACGPHARVFRANALPLLDREDIGKGARFEAEGAIKRKCGKGEPVVEVVLLEVRVRDHKEARQQRGRVHGLAGHNVGPDQVAAVVQQGALVERLEGVQRVRVAEGAGCRELASVNFCVFKRRRPQLQTCRHLELRHPPMYSALI